MKSLTARIVSIGRTFGRAPILFILLQIPEVSVDWLDRGFRSYFEAHPFIGALTLFPYFTVASALSTALTAIAVAHMAGGRKTSVTEVFRALTPRLGLLIKTSLLSGLFVLVGMPVLFPAIYFMTVYLLVPLVVVFDPPALAFSLLARSKNIVRARFWPVFFFTIFFLSVGVGMFLVQGGMDKRLIDQMGYPVYVGAIVDTVFSIALGIGVNLGIYEVFCWLQPASANLPSGDRGIMVPTNT